MSGGFATCRARYIRVRYMFATHWPSSLPQLTEFATITEFLTIHIFFLILIENNHVYFQNRQGMRREAVLRGLQLNSDKNITPSFLFLLSPEEKFKSFLILHTQLQVTTNISDVLVAIAQFNDRSVEKRSSTDISALSYVSVANDHLYGIVESRYGWIDFDTV